MNRDMQSDLYNQASGLSDGHRPAATPRDYCCSRPAVRCCCEAAATAPRLVGRRRRGPNRVPPSKAAKAALMTAFRQALKDAGYVEGKNVTIYFRSADGQTDRLVKLDPSHGIPLQAAGARTSAPLD